MARRTINRMEKRAEYEAYERRQTEDGADEEEDDDDDDDEADDDAGDDEEAAVEPTDEAEEEAEEEEVKPKKKKAKEPKKPAKSRSRAAKAARMRVVWGVFNNSNVRVATYDYPKKADAEEHALRLQNDKKQTHFVQPVKEPIEEKKEQEK